MTDYIYKYPRLYLNARFEKNAEVALSAEQNHYLKNVLRKKSGDHLRLFNAQDGEWLARITDLKKKQAEAVLTEQIKQQSPPAKKVHLYFSPLKKQRMDMMIEKAVELGATDLTPVLMHRTENRKINMDRMHAQIIEASEQCERMDIPQLHQVKKLDDLFSEQDRGEIYIALERAAHAKPIGQCDLHENYAFLIGPEGGFDEQERELLLGMENMVPICLGPRILRAETAAIVCLSSAMRDEMC